MNKNQSNKKEPFGVTGDYMTAGIEGWMDDTNKPSSKGKFSRQKNITKPHD
jgi:subtilase family serine protease